MKTLLMTILTAVLLYPATGVHAQIKDQLRDSPEYTSLVAAVSRIDDRIEYAQSRINDITQHIRIRSNLAIRANDIRKDINTTKEFLARTIITTPAITELLAEINRMKLAEIRIAYLLGTIDKYFNGLKRIPAIQERYRQVRDAARDTDNEIALKLLQDIAADQQAYYTLNTPEAALTLLRSLEDRIESAYNLVIRKQKAEQVVLRSWERLQKLLSRLDETTGSEPAKQQKKRIQALTAEIETALGDREYVKASRLISSAERMILNVLADRNDDAQYEAGQPNPAENGRRMLQSLQERMKNMPGRRAEQLRPLLQEASELLDQADELTADGDTDKADAASRRAVRLLLRIRDALADAGQGHGNAAERAAQLKDDVRQLLDRAGTNVTGPGARILDKAEDFYVRGVRALENRKPKGALKHLQAARKLAERSLHMGADENRDENRTERLRNELEAVRRTVRDAAAKAGRTGNNRARGLCSLAGELAVKAEQAFAAGRLEVAAEKLIAASRCARRAGQLESAPAGNEEALKTEVEQEAAVLAKTLPQLSAKITSTSPPAAQDLYDEAEALAVRADRYLATGDLEAARITYAMAGTFTTRAAGLLNYEEQARRRITALLDQVRRRTGVAGATDPDAASLLELADEFVRKSSRSLAAGALRMAEEQAGAALSLVTRAEDLSSGNAAETDETLDSRIKSVDRDIERARQLLRK